MTLVAEYRKKVGLSQEEVAKRLGIGLPWYLDLEAYEDELSDNLSLAHLQVLSEILKVEPCTLLLGEKCFKAKESVGFADLVQRLKIKMSNDRLTEPQMSEKVGWELKDVLIDPQELWNFNVDGLKDLCGAVGVDWLSVLPGRPDTSIERCCLPEH
jgi:transcriptional regulator with XRE-family HTH domain